MYIIIKKTEDEHFSVMYGLVEKKSKNLKILQFLVNLSILSSQQYRSYY